MTLQSKIDSLDYPPTYQYDLATLRPKGHLGKRMLQTPNIMFYGKSFLDIGCNKGFFSLVAQKGCDYVEGIDVDEKYVTLCKELGINAIHTTFRDYTPSRKFDRIMMGNVMHYLYRECGDWSWIIKLASISNGLVLIEAPTGMDCKNMKPVFSKELAKNFNHDIFMEKMGKFFILNGITNSPSQGRYIMLFERKKEKSLDYSALNVNEYELIKQNDESTIFKDDTNIIKLQNNRTIQDEIKCFIASHSPISNGIECMIYSGERFMGWIEKYIDTPILKRYQKEKEVLEKLCEHQVYLAKLGYTELDMGMSNFFEDLIIYDKGGVFPIKDLHPLAIEDINNGYFFKMFKNNYKMNIDYEKIHEALNTRDSLKIERMYETLMETDRKKATSLLFDLGCMGIGIGIMGFLAIGIAWYHGGV
jgi:SAM-dependent methyltransferase